MREGGCFETIYGIVSVIMLLQIPKMCSIHYYDHFDGWITALGQVSSAIIELYRILKLLASVPAGSSWRADTSGMRQYAL